MGQRYASILATQAQAESFVVLALRTCGFSGPHILLGMPEFALLGHMVRHTDVYMVSVPLLHFKLLQPLNTE